MALTTVAAATDVCARVPENLCVGKKKKKKYEKTPTEIAFTLGNIKIVNPAERRFFTYFFDLLASPEVSYTFSRFAIACEYHLVSAFLFDGVSVYSVHTRDYITKHDR